MKDSSLLVARQTIKSTGQTKDREFVPILIKKLADKQFRMAARDALTEYGNRVLGTLRDYLNDDSVDFVVRKNIPSVLREIPSQESVNILTEGLISADPQLKFYILKALNKLRSKYSELNFDQKKIDSVIINETKSYYETLQILEIHKEYKENLAGKLLKRALEEKLDNNLERIFRLLGLRYPPEDVYNSYQGIISDKSRLRANAIEFLDNLLNKEIKKHLLPIFDQDSPNMIIQYGKKLFGLQIKTFNDALENLVRGNDDWLKACAIYMIPEVKADKLDYLIREAMNDRNPIVRGTAELIIKRINK